MLSLKEHTSTHRAKLARRLEKQGVRFISELPYDQYLRSTLWKSIRDWVVVAQAGKCSICNREAAEVHHHDYTEATMWGERSDGLVGLCPRCHDLIEFDGNRVKREALVEKRVVYEQLLETFENFKREGFPLAVKREGLTVTVEYIGKPASQQFMECISLAYGFVVSFVRGEITFPLPFGREKFAQKTGVKLSLRSTKKHVATVWAEASCITIKHTKTCTFPLEEHLRNYLHAKPHVSIVA